MMITCIYALAAALVAVIVLLVTEPGEDR